MAAPNLSFTASGTVVSGAAGYDSISVSFTADAAYAAFQCRATKAGADWGLGKGVLVAAFSATPADTARTFEIYDGYLTAGDGAYRISLFVQGQDGSWNDNQGFIPSGATGLVTADNLVFLSMKG